MRLPSLANSISSRRAGPGIRSDAVTEWENRSQW